MIIDSRTFLEITLDSKQAQKSVSKSASIIIFENITEDFIKNHYDDSDFSSKCVTIFPSCKTVIFNNTCQLFNFYMINSVVFPKIENIYTNSHFNDQNCYRRFPKDYWHFTYCTIVPIDYEDTCVISHSEFERVLNDSKKQINDSKSIFTKFYEKLLMYTLQIRK